MTYAVRRNYRNRAYLWLNYVAERVNQTRRSRHLTSIRTYTQPHAHRVSASALCCRCSGQQQAAQHQSRPAAVSQLLCAAPFAGTWEPSCGVLQVHSTTRMIYTKTCMCSCTTNDTSVQGMLFCCSAVYISLYEPTPNASTRLHESLEQ